jgi:hemophore-related protein
MVRLSLTKLAVAVGGAAIALTAAGGIASADDWSPAVNTTCNYGQVMAALNANDPSAAAQFNQSPMAQNFLRSFLASPPPKRQQMADQAAAMPGAAKYFGTVNAVMSTCNNF